MGRVPNRVDVSSQMWFYEQHRQLWTWVAGLTINEIRQILGNYPGYPPDYAIKRAWPGWGDRWGLTYGSFACEVGGNTAKRCFKCPLGIDYCQQTVGGYQRFLESIRSGDFIEFKAAALEVRDAWVKPVVQNDVNRWW